MVITLVLKGVTILSRGKTYAKEATRWNWREKWLRNARFRLLFQQMMRDVGVLSTYLSACYE